MQFELQMTGRRRVGVVNLDFVEVDRLRRARSREYRDDTQTDPEKAYALRHARSG